MTDSKPTRVNRCIELLEAGEMLFYTSVTDLTYENGKAQSGTWADFLLVDFEHGPFETAGLLKFMRGLLDAGPAPSGHATPTVLTTLPSNCRTLEEVRANAWQIRQVLSCGVHGVLHTHARQADAVRAFVEECRYPFHTEGLGGGLGQGQRGAGGQRIPAEIWGVDPVTYTRIADPWPLNPKGELLLGLKLEDKECVANAANICKTPGIAFAEWGPGDMGMSFGYYDAHDPPYTQDLDQARSIIKKACDENGIFFLSSWNDPNRSFEDNLQTLLDMGVRMTGAGEEQASIGRRITGRKM